MGGLFKHPHRDARFVSSVLMDPISKTLVAALHRFVAEAGVPLIDFRPGRRKDDIAKAFLADFDGDERWAKRQAAKAGVGFEALDDGFCRATTPLACSGSVTG